MYFYQSVSLVLNIFLWFSPWIHCANRIMAVLQLQNDHFYTIADKQVYTLENLIMN